MTLLLCLLHLLLGSIRANVELRHDPVPCRLGVLSDLSEDGFRGSRSTVLEVRVLSAGESTQLVQGGSLGNGLERVSIP